MTGVGHDMVTLTLCHLHSFGQREIERDDPAHQRHEH
jgi:hypothetical protein